MNLEQLVDQFDLITDAEEGLEQLRKVILNLAVRGNLTNNISTNGSASQLLKEIEEEKKRQKDNGLITRIPDVKHETVWAKKLSRYPDDWLVTKLGNVLNLEYGKGLPTKKRNSDGSYPVYGSNGPMDYHDEYLVEGPCLVIGRKGSAGAINLIYENCWPTDVTYFVKPTDSIDIKFSYYLLKSLGLEELAKGIKPGLNRNEAYELLVGIPPLEYQNKIVQKVETLFSQVDELEQKVQQDREVDERLQVAVLVDLQSAETPEASRRSWRRLTDHFEQIYCKPEHIDQLKQAILNEAVRGRLVPQDPNDESAEKLLERIREEKERLYEEGEIRKPKDLPEIKVKKIPYELPSGWLWTRLGDVVQIHSSKRIYKKEYVDEGIPFFRSKEIGELGKGDYQESEYYISESRFIELKEQAGIPKEGDLLVTSVGSLGNTWISDGRDFYYKDGNVTQVVNHDKIIIEYLKWFIGSPLFQLQVKEAVSGTAYSALTIIKFKKMLLPLPPLKEQKRIVEKVDELFAWCDDLKEKLSRSQQIDQRLLEALVNGGTN